MSRNTLKRKKVSNKKPLEVEKPLLVKNIAEKYGANYSFGFIRKILASISSSLLNIQKKYLVIVIFGVIILLLSLSFSWITNKSSINIEFEQKTQVFRKVSLEIANISFVTSSEGDDPNLLVIKESNKSQQITNYFLEKGVDKADININNSFYSLTGSIISSGLTVQNNLQTYYRITVRDIVSEESVNNIFADLYSMGINRTGITVYSSQNLDQICRELRIEAKEKADKEINQILLDKKIQSVYDIKYEVIEDCVGNNFDYFGINKSLDINSLLYGSPDMASGFSTQKQDLKTIIKILVKYRI